MAYRILVTGSRFFRDEELLADALEMHALDAPEGEQIVIVHGDCPTGADQLAAAWGREQGYTVEAHPANWREHGKPAGPMRNQRMVDLGADICLAFPLKDSLGTRDCMRRAEKAGIPVVTYANSRVG